MPNSIASEPLSSVSRPRAGSVPPKRERRKTLLDCVLIPPLKGSHSKPNGLTASNEPVTPTKGHRVLRSVSHAALPTARNDAVIEIDARSQHSSKSAKSTTSRKSRKPVPNDTANGISQFLPSPERTDNKPGSSSSASTARERKGRKRNPSSGDLTEATSASSKSLTEIAGNAPNGTATKKRQRMLIDAGTGTGQRKSTVASTRDPLEEEDDDVIMSDARDEPFEEDFEIDFQMLRLDEVVTPPWVPAGTGATSMYVPPGAQQLILGMKRSLDNVEKARRKMEERYLQEMHKRIALENELARLRRCITLGSIQLSSPDPDIP